MDGEDLSRYDDVGKRQRDDNDDTEALDQLEWELASQEGRVTGANNIVLIFLVLLHSSGRTNITVLIIDVDLAEINTCFCSYN